MRFFLMCILCISYAAGQAEQQFGLRWEEPSGKKLLVYDLANSKILETIELASVQGIEFSVENHQLIIKDTLGYKFFDSEGASTMTVRPYAYLDQLKIVGWEYEYKVEDKNYTANSHQALNDLAKIFMLDIFRQEIAKVGKTRYGHLQFYCPLQGASLFYNPIAKSFWPGEGMGIRSRLVSVQNNTLEIIEPAIDVLCREQPRPDPALIKKLEGFWQKWQIVLNLKDKTYLPQKVGKPYKP